MSFVEKRLRFRNGERHTVLSVPGGLPIHEVTLFLSGFRKKGKAANTIYLVCRALAFTYRELLKQKIDLLARIQAGRLLTLPEVNRLAAAVQYRAVDSSGAEKSDASLIDIRRIRPRRTAAVVEALPIGVSTQASRLRYTADYLEFLVAYFRPELSKSRQETLERESAEAIGALRAQIPPVPRRGKLDARTGISREDQDLVVDLVRPGSKQNPWKRGFVQRRNFLIVVLLLATGMRRGELLGIQLSDLEPSLPKLSIERRADAKEDPRINQPNTKTNGRQLELRPAIMRLVWEYINDDRRELKAARKCPQLIVTDDGQPLSLKSIDKLFAQIRKACPGLATQLSSHVFRHTWNDRFSEEAESMGLSAANEERARNDQQGWADNSKTAITYTRRYAARKGRELSLKLQERLDVSSQ